MFLHDYHLACEISTVRNLALMGMLYGIFSITTGPVTARSDQHVHIYITLTCPGIQLPARLILPK